MADPVDEEKEDREDGDEVAADDRVLTTGV